MTLCVYWVSSDMYSRRGLKSAYASAHCDHNLRCSHKETSQFLFFGYPECAQWIIWSDCANAQADLNLCWAHMQEDTFSDVAACTYVIINWLEPLLFGFRFAVRTSDWWNEPEYSYDRQPGNIKRTYLYFVSSQCLWLYRKNFNDSNTDVSFTVAHTNWFLSP